MFRLLSIYNKKFFCVDLRRAAIIVEPHMGLKSDFQALTLWNVDTFLPTDWIKVFFPTLCVFDVFWMSSLVLTENRSSLLSRCEQLTSSNRTIWHVWLALLRNAPPPPVFVPTLLFPPPSFPSSSPSLILLLAANIDPPNYLSRTSASVATVTIRTIRFWYKNTTWPWTVLLDFKSAIKKITLLRKSSNFIGNKCIQILHKLEMV